MTIAPQRRRRGIRSWIRGGGAANLLFALPLVLVFAVFSWSPIIRSVIMMSFQKTNLITTSVGGAFDNFENVLTDPLLGIGRCVNTLYFAVLALVFGFPHPAAARGAHERGQKRARVLYSALAYLPGGHPAGRRRAAVEVLLRREPHRGVQHDARLGGHRHRSRGCRTSASAMPSLVIEATWAAAGGSHHHLPRGPARAFPPELYDAAEVDGASVWRKVWHVTLPQLRGVRVHHADPAGDRDRADLPRALPLHWRRGPEQRDGHDPAC